MSIPTCLTYFTCLATLVTVTYPPAVAETSLGVDAAQRPTDWIITHQGRRLMVYSMAPEKYKPYVKELYSLKGLNLLRDAPHDHLHHHALMYGIRVNGLNFWEETSGCGIQRPAQTGKPELSVSADGLPRATLRQNEEHDMCHGHIGPWDASWSGILLLLRGIIDAGWCVCARAVHRCNPTPRHIYRKQHLSITHGERVMK